MTISLGLNGASTLTSGANAQDLSPNYAGSVFGIANFFATMSGFLSPLTVSFFTKNQVEFAIKSSFISSCNLKFFIEYNEGVELYFYD